MTKLFLVLLLSMISLSAAGDQKRICYYTNWSQYRPEPYTFLPENIDPFLCTHIYYAFAGLNGNVLATTEDNDEDLIARVMALRDQNPDLMVMLSVGGWGQGVAAMSSMLATPENRTEFVTTSIPFLQSRGFDGLDLDFEFPGMIRDDFDPPQISPPEDKQRFTALVQELRAAYTDQGLLLTAAVSCNQDVIDDAYEIGPISQDLDWIGLMSYDLNTPFDPLTTCHSALIIPDEEYIPERYVNKSVDFCFKYFEAGGTPREKLLMGIPAYGRSFELLIPEVKGLYSPAAGQGTPIAPAIYEICEQYLINGTRTFATDHGVPYAWDSAGGVQWVSYDDVESINLKMDYLIANNYAGVIVWALDLDDFDAISSCFDGQTYPLISVIRDRLEAAP